MPAYEICYIDDSGNLARAFSVLFDNELRAKILAHAMKPSDCHQREGWEGDRLVYSRPEQIAEAGAAAIESVRRRPAVCQSAKAEPKVKPWA